MSAVAKAIEDGFAYLAYSNALNSTTIVLFSAEEWAAVQKIVDRVPDDRVIDIMGAPTAEALEAGVARIGRKIRREGEYVDWDERMQRLGLQD